MGIIHDDVPSGDFDTLIVTKGFDGQADHQAMTMTTKAEMTLKT